MHSPDHKWLSFLLIPMLLSGCLGKTYEIRPDEIERILKTPAEERGLDLQVSQELRESITDRTSPDGWHAYHVHHVTTPPPHRRHHAHIGTKSQQNKNTVEDQKGAAIALAIIGVAITLTLVGTEGSRFQGFVTVDPNHPVHILGQDGSYAWNYLAKLKPEDLQPGDRLIVAEDEGNGFEFNARFPLEREGFVWRMELGMSQNKLPADEDLMGAAMRMNLGYFGSQTLGFGFMTHFTGGSKGDLDFYNFRYGLELQAMPFNTGALHLGFYGWGGFAYNNSSDGVSNDFETHGPAMGGGLLLELDLNTTLALSLRGGGAWESRDSGFRYDGITTMLGISIY